MFVILPHIPNPCSSFPAWQRSFPFLLLKYRNINTSSLCWQYQQKGKAKSDLYHNLDLNLQKPWGGEKEGSFFFWKFHNIPKEWKQELWPQKINLLKLNTYLFYSIVVTKKKKKLKVLPTKNKPSTQSIHLHKAITLGYYKTWPNYMVPNPKGCHLVFS